MLQVIMAGASAALKKSKEGDRATVEAILQEIIESSRFGARAVRGLLEFVELRIGEAVPEQTFDLSDIALQATETTRKW